MYCFVLVMIFRPKDISKLTDEDAKKLQDGDTLVMRFIPRVQHVNDYGKKTYTPMVQQSDHGISKFYSILKYLVCIAHNISGRFI